jgi:membrane fusion protein (multidrug efflux system)/multidrug efflux system membrane fusion protein
MRIRALVLASVLAVGGCADAEVPGVAQAAAAAPAKPRSAKLIEEPAGWVGVLLPAGVADVAPTVEGKIDRIQVTVGQSVEKGAALATFDPAAAREALAIAKGDLKAAQGMVAEASAMAGHARRRLNAERKLFAKGITAADDVSAANADRRKAGGAASSAMGQVASARARIEMLERQLKETSLAAPFAGRVALVYRENGALAGPAQPVVRLIDTSKSYVRFAVPSVEASALGIGHSLDVIVDGLPRVLRAHVRHLAPEVDAATGLVFLEAEIIAADASLVTPQSPAWVRRAKV